MDAADVDLALSEAETALARSAKADLARIGFWKTVAAAKRDRPLVDLHDHKARAIVRQLPVRQMLPDGDLRRSLRGELSFTNNDTDERYAVTETLTTTDALALASGASRFRVEPFRGAWNRDQTVIGDYAIRADVDFRFRQSG